MLLSVGARSESVQHIGGFSRYFTLQAGGKVVAPVPFVGMPGYIERVFVNGSSLIKFTLYSTDPKTAGGLRSELTMPYEPFGVRRSYKFRYLIPLDWIDEVGGTQIFFQMHGSEDVTAVPKSPCLALQIRTDRIFVSLRHTSDRAPTVNPKEDLVAYWLIEKGVLVDIEIIARWWPFGDSGEISVYKDGSLIYAAAGPTCYNEAKGPYPKIGIYHWEPFPYYLKSQSLYISDLQIIDR
jgi:hypothetical protein